MQRMQPGEVLGQALVDIDQAVRIETGARRRGIG